MMTEPTELYHLDDLDGVELRRVIVGELEQLTPPQREVVELYYYGGYNCKEIAEARGTTHKSARKLLGRARRILKGHLDSDLLEASAQSGLYEGRPRGDPFEDQHRLLDWIENGDAGWCNPDAARSGPIRRMTLAEAAANPPRPPRLVAVPT